MMPTVLNKFQSLCNVIPVSTWDAKKLFRGFKVNLFEKTTPPGMCIELLDTEPSLRKHNIGSSDLLLHHGLELDYGSAIHSVSGI